MRKTTVAALLLLTLGLGLPAHLPAKAADPPVAKAEALLKSDDYLERKKGLELLETLEYSARVENAAIKALGDEDWGVQMRAAKTLGRIGKDAAVKALLKQAIEGEIQWVRVAAIDALEALKVDDIGSKLLDRAKGKRKDPRVPLAIRAAGRFMTPEHRKRLQAHTKSKDLRAAGAAAYVLGTVTKDDAGRADVLKTLSSVLRQRGDRKHFFAYAGAVSGLAGVDAPEVRAVLVDELLLAQDGDLYIPERIARGFAKMDQAGVAEALNAGFARAKKPLHKWLLAWVTARAGTQGVENSLVGLLDDGDERVRAHALRALGRSGAIASVDAVTAKLDDPSPYARLEAVTALRHLLPPEGFRDLYPRIKQDGKAVVRLQFVVELEGMGDPAAIPVLETMLEDKSWRVVSAAAASIGTLGVADDLPRLEPLLSHKDWKNRAAAYEGLGRLRAAAAIPLLAEGLADKDPVVVGVCHANLQILCREKLDNDPNTWREWWEKNGKGLVLKKQSRKTEEQKLAEMRAKKDKHKYVRASAIEILQKARIVVITGAWDKVQLVLEHLDIPHELMRAQELKSSGLNPNQILLVNCEGNMDSDTRERVSWFVNVGGYLMSTDWALTKTIMPTFPGYMTQFAGSNTGNDVVVVEEGTEGHPLTAGVFENVPALKWWLEIQAFPIQVSYPERCDVIVDSAEMRQKYGSSPMATVFHWGLGKVQHSLSHFYLQEEGMTQAKKGRPRMIFAADNLGISLQQIRELAKEGRFDGQLNEEAMKAIAPDYSMFRLIVNMVREKSEWVEGL